MSEQHRRRAREIAKAMSISIAVFVGGTVLLLWSWNTLAADLFELPMARFKHAFALALLIASTLIFRFLVARSATNGCPHSDHRG